MSYIRKYLIQFLYCFLSILLMVDTAHAWKMEAGKLSLSATSALTQLESHSFQQVYDTPPIVIALPTTAGGDAGAVRISDITTSGFRMSPVEPRSEDGPHAAMTVSYIAIEAGTHTFPNGEVIQAGTISSSQSQYNGNPAGQTGWETLTYSQGFSSPIVIAAIQTIENETGNIPDQPSHPWLTIAINNITDTQVDIALERSEVYDRLTGSNFHFDNLSNQETLGYIIMDSGVIGNLRANGNSRIDFESSYYTNSVDGWSDGCNDHSFAGTYSGTPIAVATKSSHNEADGGWLRECSVNASRIQLTIDEDDDQDGERSHATEDTSLLVFSNIFFYDSEAATSLESSDTLMLETNFASLAPNSFTTINFEQVYEFPPAVFVLEDNENPEPSSIRIRNITEQSFEVVPVEPDSRISDATDQNTLIHYLAISKGQHAFPDGKLIEIGPTVPPNTFLNFQAKQFSGDSWFSFGFDTAFSTTPALLSQIQTMNNEPTHTPGSASSPWLTTATRNISSNGGDLALDRAETSTGTLSTAEEIAYLATEPGVITSFIDVSGNTILAEAQATPDSIQGTQTCYDYNFLQTYPDPPLVMGSQMTWDGGDGGWLRRCSTNNTRVSLKIEEDWARDTDNNHTSERAGFLAFSQPFYADLSLVANYQLETSGWNGTAGEVIDSSNTGAHGQRMGNATSRPAKVCNGALLDGTGDYIEIPDNNTLDISDELTVMAWINPASFPSSDLMTIVSKDTNFEFHIDTTGEILWWWNNEGGSDRSFTSNGTTVSLGNWHHVAITYSRSAGSQKIYIDGMETANQTYANESLINNNLPLYIGTDDNFPSRDFNGRIDEVKIFKRALPVNAIQKYASETRPCASCALDHFDISQPSSTLACPDTRAEVTVTARCADNTVKEDFLGTVNLSAPLGSTFYNAPIAGNAITDLTYEISDEGVSTAYLYFDNEQDAVQVTASDSFTSINSTATSGTDFRAFGFKVNTQPDSFACASSTSMSISAFGKINNSSGSACEVLTGFTGDKTLDVWYRATLDNNSTAQYVTHDLVVDGNPINAQDDSADNNLTLNFSNGTSNFNIGYPNSANILDLNFRYDSAPYDNTEFSVMSASTESFAVHPSSFSLAATTGSKTLNGSNSNANVTHKAGEAFNLSITAMCSDSLTVATDYRANTPSSILTRLQRTAPNTSNSVDGSMQISADTLLTSSAPWEATTLNFQNNGIHTHTASYSEVGTTRLYIRDQNYFGEEIAESFIDIGRFIPDHFEVQVNSGRLSAYCSPGSPFGFSYIQQEINYASTPSLTITALNTSNAVTRNYTEGGFLKLDPDNGITRVFPNEDYTAVGSDNYKMTLTSNALRPIFFTSASNGVMEYTFLNTDSYTYLKNSNAKTAPFISDIRVNVTAIKDSDDVEANALPYQVLPSSIQLRYGRLVMDNAFGPEISALPIPMRIEHWNGSAFETNTDDNCTHYNAINITDTESLSGGSTTPSGNGIFTSGSTAHASAVSLSAPGTGNVGTVDLDFEVDDWLKYDWDNDNTTADTNPTATATFGQYRGNDRVIYWREVLN